MRSSVAGPAGCANKSNSVPRIGKQPTTTLHRLLIYLAIIGGTATTANTLLSYGLASVARPGRHVQATEITRFIAGFVPALQDLLNGERFADPVVFLAVYLAPQSVNLAVFIAALLLLNRRRSEIGSDVVGQLLRGAGVFAMASFLAVPVTVPDFWLSPAWGRMVASGVNPYYNDLTAAWAQGLPLDVVAGQRMTYGRAWALISGLLAFVAGDSTILSFVLFKLVLCGTWFGSCVVIACILKPKGPVAQALGVVIFGWMPMSFHQAVAEGHNDIAMILPLLLWLYWVANARSIASLALAISMGVKYVTAPLLLIDFVAASRIRRQSVWNYIKTAIPGGSVLLVLAALFWRGPGFFSAATQMRNWHAFDPAHAVYSLLGFFQVNFQGSGLLVRIAFAVWGILVCLRGLSQPAQNLFRMSMAVTSVVLFSLTGHLWPWFLIWLLPFAAICPSYRFSRWVIGLALGALSTFPMAFALVFTNLSSQIRWELSSIVFHITGIIGLFAVPAKWFSVSEQPTKSQ